VLIDVHVDRPICNAGLDLATGYHLKLNNLNVDQGGKGIYTQEMYNEHIQVDESQVDKSTLLKKIWHLQKWIPKMFEKKWQSIEKVGLARLIKQYQYIKHGFTFQVIKEKNKEIPMVERCYWALNMR
jgi:hypothetical protein